MSPIARISILILAIVGGMLYKQLSEMLSDAQVPYLPVNQWWGDEAEPTDWQTYLANTSHILSNKVHFPKKVNETCSQPNKLQKYVA